MAAAINITNLTTGPYSIDVRFQEGKQLRANIAAGASINASALTPNLTVDEVNANPQLALAVASGKILITPHDSSEGRIILAADSTLAANVIGAATEAVHGTISIPQNIIALARRRITFYARLRVLTSNGADTWLYRARLGGLTGAALVASAAFDITNDDVTELTGSIEVRTLGAAGTFASVARVVGIPGVVAVNTGTVAGTLVTTAAVSLVITGTCSSASAGNTVRLEYFTAEFSPI